MGSALNLRRIVCCLLLVCARVRSCGRACCALLWSLRNFFPRGPLIRNRRARVDFWTRAVERCTGVTNAVFGAADGAAVLAELTPPLMGWEVEIRQVRWGWEPGNSDQARSIGAVYRRPWSGLHSAGSCREQVKSGSVANCKQHLRRSSVSFQCVKRHFKIGHRLRARWIGQGGRIGSCLILCQGFNNGG